VWVSLYRDVGGTWVRLPSAVPPSPRRGVREPNLRASFNRNYGENSPLKALLLDATMERIRVEGQLDHLRDQESLIPNQRRPLDASYIPLLERYNTPDSPPSVRFAAESALTGLGRAGAARWIETLEDPTRPDIDRWTASIALGPIIDGRTQSLKGRDRKQLIAAARHPEPIDRARVPQPAPARQDIVAVKGSTQFGLVVVQLGRGDGSRGYSMLFERRGGRWIFLCLSMEWIS
jgi:hypothetical protein